MNRGYDHHIPLGISQSPFQERGHHPRAALGLGGLLLNTNDFTRCRHQTRRLCDSKTKTKLLIIMFEHRRNLNIIQTMKITKYPPVLANVSDCCFFINHSLDLSLFLSPYRKELLRYHVTELPSLPDSTQPRAKLHFLEPCPKSPNTSPNPLSPF